MSNSQWGRVGRAGQGSKFVSEATKKILYGHKLDVDGK